MKISNNSTSDKSSLVAKCLIILYIYQQEFRYLKYLRMYLDILKI